MKGVRKIERPYLAERVGFEPTVAQRTTTVFETAPFNHSGTSPRGVVIIARGASDIYTFSQFRVINIVQAGLLKFFHKC
jgi:hypothetical protein